MLVFKAIEKEWLFIKNYSDYVYLFHNSFS